MYNIPPDCKDLQYKEAEKQLLPQSQNREEYI